MLKIPPIADTQTVNDNAKKHTLYKMYEQLHKFLSQLQILDNQEVDYSVSLFEMGSLRKNDFFLSEKNVCDKIAFVSKGAVRAFSTLPNGGENITCFKFENQIITSFESFMLRKPSQKSIQALEDSSLMAISHRNFQHLLEKIPSWQSVINLLTKQEYIEKENYLINYNNKSAKGKYMQILTQSPEIIQRVKIEHLASYLGITQRTLTRVRKEIFNPAF